MGFSKQAGAARWGLWTFFGLVGGFLLSGVICYIQPKRYTSTVILAAHEKPGRTSELSPVHAAMVSRSLEMELRWGVSQPDAVAVIRAATRLKATEKGVEIRVSHTNREDARDIAAEAAAVFRGMDAEAALAGRPATLAPVDTKAAEDQMKLAKLMEAQAESAGADDFRMIEKRASEGDVAARTVWSSQDFQTRWKLYGKLAAQVDSVTGESMVAPLRVIERPIIADKPSSPVVGVYLNVGMLAGLLVGGIVGFLHSRVAPDDATNPVYTPPAGIPATAAPVTADIEDEW